jgi:hypothetical protein
VDATIQVTQGPNSLKLDANGKLWVLCEGDIAYDANYDVDAANSKAGALIKINPDNNTVEQTLTFASTTGSPSRLNINGAKSKLYYTYDSKVYSFDISSGALNTTPVISRKFYGISIDPIEDKIYAGTYGFSSSQKMIRYTTAGVPIDSFTVGIGPNSFVFTSK